MDCASCALGLLFLSRSSPKSCSRSWFDIFPNSLYVNVVRQHQYPIKTLELILKTGLLNTNSIARGLVLLLLSKQSTINPFVTGDDSFDHKRVTCAAFGWRGHSVPGDVSTVLSEAKTGTWPCKQLHVGFTFWLAPSRKGVIPLHLSKGEMHAPSPKGEINAAYYFHFKVTK